MPNSNHPISSKEPPADESAFPPQVLANCAQLVASGEIEWPSEISVEQAEELELLVRRARRVRLVKLIASSIAADIAREARG